MNTTIQKVSDIGEQKGSRRPRHHVFLALALLVLGSIPTSASAASRYLEDNADNFVAKTQSSYGDMINIAALLHDYDPKMITAVIVVESEGNEVAVSNKGAKGLMQLMPLTAKAMGAKNPKDPFQNILAGTKYLKELERSYGFDSPQEALVAYNMGPSRAKRWLSQYESTDYGYVKKVMYVYGVLEQQEIDNRQIARAIEKRIDAAGAEHFGPKPLMTRPRNLSLAALPFSLAATRKNELVTEN